ncbi:MAG: DUF3972 domain-containing protein [Sulfurovum sp.]|nr:DUF3972 domain-containing protein [Sulfurovum sp.]
MEKLMKPAEYAKELGISRQAVYAKIKRGILTAKDIEGKLYIVVDADIKQKKSSQDIFQHNREVKKASNASPKEKEYEALLVAKDETIAVLKGTVKDLKKSNKQISMTLRGEIDLLKEAFHEMRTLYVHQLEYQNASAKTIDIVTEEEYETSDSKQWISIKKFFKKMRITKLKQQEKLFKRIKKVWKSGDSRIQKINGKFKIDIHSNYEDMVK